MANATIIGVIIVVILLAGLYYFHFSGSKQTASSQTISYSNQKAAISFQYSQNWNETNSSGTAHGTATQIIDLYPIAPNISPSCTNTCIDFQIIAFSAANASARQGAYVGYYSELHALLTQNGAIILNQINTTVSGYNTISIVYKESPNSYDKNLVYFVNATARIPDYYIIQYSAFSLANASVNYTTYLPQVQQIINSIKIG